MTTRGKSTDYTCYAVTLPGLEAVSAEEIENDLGGVVKRTASGLIVFKPEQIDHALLQLRTVEDVFLLLWGTDQLTYRAGDLEQITRWTAKLKDWQRMLQAHHAVRPKPKGKPTYRIVTQMQGSHGYRRIDAAKALARGLSGKFPSSWRPATENASIEVWLSIQGATAVCGIRLSDKTMRHRDYKTAHLPASLRPVVAATMVRLAETNPGHRILDPMCGVGTIVAECLTSHPRAAIFAGDMEIEALRATFANTRHLGKISLSRWDAQRLPLAAKSMNRIICNPPFGKQMGRPEEIAPFYQQFVAESDRVLMPNGRAILLVSDALSLQNAVRSVQWRSVRRLRVRILGQSAIVCVFAKP